MIDELLDDASADTRRWLEQIPMGSIEAIRRQARRRAKAQVVASIAVAGGSIGGLWVIVARPTDRPATTNDETVAPTTPTTIIAARSGSTLPSVSAPVSVTSLVEDPLPTPGTPPPRIAVDLPGWTLTRVSDQVFQSDDVVVFDPAAGFDGPWVRLHKPDAGIGESFGNERAIQVGGVSGTMSGRDGYRLLQWSTTGGELWAYGWQLDDQALVDLVANVRIDETGAVVVPSSPTGFTVTNAQSVSLDHYSEYQFDRNDGTRVQISFYPGGPQALALRVQGETLTTLDAGNEQLSVLAESPPDGRYRGDILRGFWTWEIDGGPFTSTDEFVQFFGHLRIVDEAEWQANLPPDVTASPVVPPSPLPTEPVTAPLP